MAVGARVRLRVSAFMNFPFRKFPPLGPPKLSARQKTLHAWRGLNEVELQKASAERSRDAAQIMPGVLKSIRIDRRQSEAEIVKVWSQLMDPVLVAHAQPTGLNKGTLFVTVDSSVWLSEIVRYRRKEILSRLQHAFGSELIAKISFRLG